MSIVDQVELEDLFDDELNVTDFQDQYAKVDFLPLVDTNKGVYSSGMITFNTAERMTDWTILRDSILSIPLNIAGAVAYTANTRLAIKTSILSLIYGLQVTCSNGTLVNETAGSTSLMANIRLLKDSDIAFISSAGQSLQFFGADKKTLVLPGASRDSTVSSGYLSLPADPTVCPAILNRVTVMENKHLVGTAFNFVANIPLKFIHSFFENMSFPLSNFPLRINFYLSGYGNNTFAPFHAPVITKQFVSSSVSQAWTSCTLATPGVVTVASTANYYVGMPFYLQANGATSTVPTTVPVITYNQTLYVVSIPTATTFTFNAPGSGTGVQVTADQTNGTTIVAGINGQASQNSYTAATPPAYSGMVSTTFNDRGNTLGSAILFLKTVSLNSDALAKLEKRLSNGAKKVIEFSQTENFTFLANPVSATSITRDICTTVRQPTRMWVMVPTNVGGVTPATDSMNQLLPGYVGPNFLYNTNIMLNGKQYYAQDLANQEEFYNILSTQFPGAGVSSVGGAQWSIEDFKNGNSVYLFDLSRYRNADPNAALTIRLKSLIGVLNGVGAPSPPTDFYDLICLVEHRMKLILNMSKSSVIATITEGI